MTSSSPRLHASVVALFPESLRGFTEASILGRAQKAELLTTSEVQVRDLADEVCSTEKMITFCKTHSSKQFVVVTESGIIHRLQRECPDKEFLPAPVFDVMRMPADNCRCSECKYMKLNTLEKVRDCMKNLSPQIELPPDIQEWPL